MFSFLTCNATYSTAFLNPRSVWSFYSWNLFSKQYRIDKLEMTSLKHPFSLLYGRLTVQLTPHEDICFHSKNSFYFGCKIVFISVLLNFYSHHETQQVWCRRLSKSVFSSCMHTTFWASQHHQFSPKGKVT
jgi:hypothetical protein